jgi:hypothetical protein
LSTTDTDSGEDDPCTGNELSEYDVEIPLSAPHPYVLGPMTSTQIGPEIVIPDTEDQEEYRRRYEDPEQCILPRKTRRVD